MQSSLPPGYEYLEGLLFVTTESVRARDGADDRHVQSIAAAALDYVEAIVGDRLFIIPGQPVDAYEAANHVGPVLEEYADSIRGVVILGDYETVPARPVQMFSPERLQQGRGSNPGEDRDEWWVWNDDLYGDNDNDLMAEVPVSRIPIVPSKGGILGDLPISDAANPLSFGLRASEFTFADAVYRMISDPPDLMLTSPDYAQFPSRDRRASGNWSGPDLVEGDLAADRVYLVLHGLDGYDMQLTGTIDSGFNPVAVNDVVVGGDSWESRGVVFSGACWGGLTADPIPLKLDPGEHVIARTVDQAFPLAFLDHGANAVVGFTGAHYIPRGDVGEGVSGAPLHCAFWKNIVDRGWPPAKALFEAKARFIVDTEKRSTDPLAIAKDMKTFWSATCLGLGW